MPGPNRCPSGPDHGDYLDLDPSALNREAADLDQRARRPGFAEELLSHRVDLLPIVNAREVDRHPCDVGERRAGGREHRLNVPEDLPRLRDNVIAADEAPLCIDGDAAGDEDEVADTHGVCVVRDRLRLSGDADHFSIGHEGDIIPVRGAAVHSLRRRRLVRARRRR